MNLAHAEQELINQAWIHMIFSEHGKSVSQEIYSGFNNFSSTRRANNENT